MNVFRPGVDYTIADGGSGLRTGQKVVMPETPGHGDVFHAIYFS